MTERDKILYAKSYIDALANGVNPISGELIPDSETISQVKIVRCLFYVSSVLQKVCDDLAEPEKPQPQKKAKKPPFTLGADQRAKLTISPDPIPISILAKKLSEENGTQEMAPLGYSPISNWLESVGLMRKNEPEMRPFRIPTEQGIKAGMSVIERDGPNGSYLQVLYDSSMQQLIADNLPAILALRDNSKA